MAEERMRVLDMIREGKITAEEGTRLLEALKAAQGSPSGEQHRPFGEQHRPFGEQHRPFGEHGRPWWAQGRAWWEQGRRHRQDDPVGSIVDAVVEAISHGGWHRFGGGFGSAWTGGNLRGLARRREREAEGWEFLRFSEGKHGTFEFPEGARLQGESEAGGVEAVAGDGPARLDLEGDGPYNYDVYVARKGDMVLVAAHRTEPEARMPRLKLSVPRHVRHVELRTAGGSLKSRGFACPVSLKTAGGGIRIEDHGEGEINARTMGGSVEVSGTPSAVTLHTAGGSIRFRGHTKSLDARTAGGSISIEGARLTSGEHRAKTAGGSIRVLLTPDSSVELNAGTSAGSLNVDLPGAAGQYGGSRISPRYHGKYHGGTARLEIRTVGGSVHVGLSAAAEQPSAGEGAAAA